MEVTVDYPEIIRTAPIVLDMDETLKVDVAMHLIDALVEAGRLAPELRNAAFADVYAREVLGGCTALANGVAIPHCRFAALDDIRVAIGVHPGGVDCGAIDGLPSRIFVLVLSSPNQPKAHIRFLSEVNRRLLLPEIREPILMARDPEAVRELLLRPVAAA
ncbi:MAG: PTS sugar transporter subunit IIA [Kiritimatiellae bacterium]|nr:PTS sugar transporter subunit IIA [Kiritimatiellia bacterium]